MNYIILIALVLNTRPFFHDVYPGGLDTEAQNTPQVPVKIIASNNSNSSNSKNKNSTLNQGNLIFLKNEMFSLRQRGSSPK